MAIMQGLSQPDASSVDYDVEEWQRFGLGTQRSLEEYKRYSHVNIDYLEFSSVCDLIVNDQFPPAGTGNQKNINK